MSEKVEVIVSLGKRYIGKMETAYTFAEWENMTMLERDTVRDSYLSSMIEIWTSFDKAPV